MTGTATFPGEVIIDAPCRIGTPCGTVDHAGTASFSVFLCPHCDDVHLHFLSPELAGGQLQFNAKLDQDAVDKLVSLLLAPRVVF